MSNVFEKVFRESLKSRVPNFNLRIMDDDSLEKAFDFIIDTIEQMAQFFIDINDTIGYNSPFDSLNGDYEKEFRSTVKNIKDCGDKVEQVCGMINKYFQKGAVKN